MSSSQEIAQIIGISTIETLIMIGASTFFSYLLGLPMGVVLVMSDKDGIHPLPVLNKVLGTIVNIVRSIPFVILLVIMLPVTRAIAGSTIGVKATVVPLVAAGAPYVARMIESSLKEVDKGVIEAAKSMGASDWQIITKVLLPEAKPVNILGAAITIITILGYTAMTGFTGGGGLGGVAINYGYYKRVPELMNISVIILIVVVQIVQVLGIRLSRKTDKRVR